MLTIRQVADAVGTTSSYLHELEHGKTVNIRLPLAAKLSRVLKISVAALAAAALEPCGHHRFVETRWYRHAEQGARWVFEGSVRIGESDTIPIWERSNILSNK
ncbi:MAG: helix-turn-helix domain-containing protein [Rudaea sp.]